MSWHYSAAPEEVFSVENYLAGLQSRRSKSKNTQGKFFSNGRGTESCHVSPSGMISGHLTGDRGEGSSMSSAGDSLAKISARRERGRASRAAARGSGLRCTESFARFDPDTCLWRTPPALTSRGLGRVLGDLAASGYDAAWLVLGAADVGAPHRRDRIWILATKAERGDEAAEGAAHDTNTDGVQCSEQGGEYEGTEELDGGSAHGLEAGGDVADSDGSGWDAQHYEAGVAGQTLGEASEQQPCGAGGGEDVADSDGERCEEQWRSGAAGEEVSAAGCCGWWSSEPAVGRVAHGVAHRVDRLKSIGNGQVPLVAATAFCELKRILEG